MTEELRFVVHGKPRPKGSMRVVGPHGRGGMKESNPAAAPWREAVKWAALHATTVSEYATGQAFTRLTGPVEVDVVFAFDKPASAPKRRRIWPITRSTYDTDKLLRNVFDALCDAAVLRDDSQVVKVTGTKTYCGDEPHFTPTQGAVVTVRPVLPGGSHDEQHRDRGPDREDGRVSAD